jgi:flagellum-specific peptidoglycan hydrolase FlgJ
MKNKIFFVICITSLFSIPCFADSRSETIRGSGVLTNTQMADILLQENAGVDLLFAEEFAAFYIKAAAAEGINHDVAFSQMCLETNFLKHDGLVEANNFGGLRAENKKERAANFSSMESGVQAHIQHLKAYTNIKELSGKWSEDPDYGEKVMTILERNHYIASRLENINSMA